MVSPLRRCASGFFAIGLILLGSARAAEPLRVELLPLNVKARANAPQGLDLKLTWDGSNLLEGVLELQLGSSFSTPFIYRSQPMVLNPGTRTVRMILPGASGNYGNQSNVRVSFRTANAVLNLGEQAIGIAPEHDKQMFIGVSTPSLIRERSRLWTGLRIELPKKPSESDPLDRFVAGTTNPVFIDPSALSADPIGYCQFDALLLEGEGLTQLRPKQLAALETWVRAGGSLWVVPAPQAPPEIHDFLQNLSTTANEATDRPQLLRVGLGRVVISSATEAAGFETPAWKQAVEFLWKQHPPKQHASNIEDLRPELTLALMPKSVRLLPRSTIVWVLGGFLLVIGPADYLILGRLRRRHLTWVLFPAAAVAFTGLTLWLANRSLGSSHHRSALLITDLDAHGQMVRETRLELLFSGRAMVVDTEGRNAIVSPLPPYSGYRNGMSGDETQSVPVYEGQFPAHFTLRQPLRQWTAQINRMTTLKSGPDTSGIAWETLAEAASEPSHMREGNEGFVLPRHALSADQLRYNSRSHNEFISRSFLQQLSVRPIEGVFQNVSQISPNGAGDLADLAMLEPEDPHFNLLIQTRREGDLLHIYRRLHAK